MKILKKHVVSLLAVVTAAVGAIFVVKRQAAPKYKTYHDIKPPTQKFHGYDESKARPVTYATNHRAKLVAVNPWKPKREVFDDCVDLPRVAGL